jgi:hypothetical protein
MMLAMLIEIAIIPIIPSRVIIDFQLILLPGIEFKGLLVDISEV